MGKWRRLRDIHKVASPSEKEGGKPDQEDFGSLTKGGGGRGSQEKKTLLLEVSSSSMPTRLGMIELCHKHTPPPGAFVTLDWMTSSSCTL